MWVSWVFNSKAVPKEPPGSHLGSTFGLHDTIWLPQGRQEVALWYPNVFQIAPMAHVLDFVWKAVLGSGVEAGRNLKGSEGHAQEEARRHPGGTQEAPRRHPETPGHPGGCQRGQSWASGENVPKPLSFLSKVQKTSWRRRNERDPHQALQIAANIGDVPRTGSRTLRRPLFSNTFRTPHRKLCLGKKDCLGMCAGVIWA